MGTDTNVKKVNDGIFKVSFDKGDINADIATGKDIGTAKGTNAPVFPDGIRGKAGELPCR